MAEDVKVEEPKVPGPLTMAFAAAITDVSSYIRYLATLGATVFLTWLVVEVAKGIDITVVTNAEGDAALQIPINIETLLPIPLLMAVLTGLIAQLGALTAGPNPLASALEKSLDIVAGAVN